MDPHRDARPGLLLGSVPVTRRRISAPRDSTATISCFLFTDPPITALIDH